jgi:hypothetical protein
LLRFARNDGCYFRNDGCYFFALRFFAVFFLEVFFLEVFFLEVFFFDAFFGTFLPSALASDSPIAMACLRLVTLRPERPLFKVPALRFFITRSTSADAFLEYFRAFRAMMILALAER